MAKRKKTKRKSLVADVEENGKTQHKTPQEEERISIHQTASFISAMGVAGANVPEMAKRQKTKKESLFGDVEENGETQQKSLQKEKRISVHKSASFISVMGEGGVNLPGMAKEETEKELTTKEAKVFDVGENDDCGITFPLTPPTTGTSTSNLIVDEDYAYEKQLNFAIMASISKSSTELEVIDVDENGDCWVYFPPTSPITGTSNSNAIAVEYCACERELNSAVMDSPSKCSKSVLNLSKEHLDDDECFGLSEPLGKRRKVTFRGESSECKNEPSFVCEICMEPTSVNGSFSIRDCSHLYCKECMIKYVASKLQENITGIRCPVPRCEGFLEPEHCRALLPKEVFERWGDALCEAMILASEKFYCPFKDCSALLINDGKEAIEESECPNCRRLFCARCKVPWHAEITCEAFQNLSNDEREKEYIMFKNLADCQKWKKCPGCKFYVQKSSGCLFIDCRCGIQFCYGCGSKAKGHICPKCHT